MAATMRAAARSVKFANYFAKRHIAVSSCKNYLSANYSCDKEWLESKQKDSLLKSLDAEIMYVDVSRKLATKSKHNLAIDVDIFLNIVEDPKFYLEMQTSLNRLRRSKHTAGTLKSTHSCFVRYCLSNGFEKELIKILLDKLNYGLFPDTQTSNIILDHCLKKNLNREAAKVAVDFALQEDPGNEISRILSLIACTKYLSEGGVWIDADPETKKTEEEEDDDEIEYVRVPNLTNPWFDDHFDLSDPNHLIGKAFIHFGKLSEGVIKDSALLIGLAQRRKWDQLKQILPNVQETSADTRELCLKIIESSHENSEADKEEDAQKSEEGVDAKSSEDHTVPEWVESELAKLKCTSAPLLELVEAELKNIEAVETADIEIIKKSFESFSITRKAALEKQSWAIERAKRFEILKQKKKQLVETEELLYVFENWNKIEMILKEIDKEQANIVQKQDEYVPPTVGKSFERHSTTVSREKVIEHKA